MSKTLHLRLKKGVGDSLTIATPNFSISIGGDGLNPAGFDMDEEIFEKYLKPYAERVPKKRKKPKKKSDINLLTEE